MADGPVPIVLREPHRGSVWGPEVREKSGLEILRAFIDRTLPDPPAARLTGLRLSEAGTGVASAAMPASVWWQSGAAVFLAGTIAFVADLPLSSAVLTGVPAGVSVASSELSLSFVRGATIRSQSINGRARLVHSTRSLGLCEATTEDGRGRLLGHATSRCVIFRGEPRALAPRDVAIASPSDGPDPYLREVEGDVLGQEYWDPTPGIEVMRQTVAGRFNPPVFLLMGMRGVDASERHSDDRHGDVGLARERVRRHVRRRARGAG